jgi:small subunit ribosomal protein S16
MRVIVTESAGEFAGRAGDCPAGAANSRSSNLFVLMAVRLRLTRVGGRKNPIWRVVVADQRSKRDGRVIETVGHYNAQTDPSTIVLDEERIRDWLARGAQPSETVRKLLRTQGIS